jgi:F0F1-type ATP synthase beta subunit
MGFTRTYYINEARFNTSIQAVYVPADDLTDPAPATTRLQRQYYHVT